MPFCFHGFWLPPVTYLRIFVDALPWRWFAMKAVTALCITGMFTVPSNVDSGSCTFSLRAVPSDVYDDTCWVCVLLSGIGYPCFRTTTIPFFGPATAPRT